LRVRERFSEELYMSLLLIASAAIAAPGVASTVLGLLSSLDQRGGQWDLDGNGEVTEADLGRLLGGGSDCRR
jgi:hypothetical protein